MDATPSGAQPRDTDPVVPSAASPEPIGEDELIAWIQAHAAHGAAALAVGPGDDCAVIHVGDAALLLKVDLCLEGVHFQRARPNSPGFATPAQAGYKAIARTVSDIAAMGGRADHLLVGLGLPRDAPPGVATELSTGLLEAAGAYRLSLAGGDTKSWPAAQIAISVSVIGSGIEVPPVLRSGGRPGDRLVVTGTLGGSIVGRHLRPVPRLAEGQWLARHGASAMIDLSDGLARDLDLVCRASGCRAVLWSEQLPISTDAQHLARTSGHPASWHALQDGEDYELLAAVPPGLDLSGWPFETPLTVIGELLPAAPAHWAVPELTEVPEPRVPTAPSAPATARVLIEEAGTVRALPPGGYLHRFG